MLMAGWRAVREYDLKLILAFGTVSQLGFITVMVGGGGRDLMLAGLAMLCARLVPGSPVHGRRCDRSLDRHPGHSQTRLAGAGQPALFVIAAGATASMAALPPLGFRGEGSDFETIAHSAALGGWALRCSPARQPGRCSPPCTASDSVGALRAQGLSAAEQMVARLHPVSGVPGPPSILAAAGLDVRPCARGCSTGCSTAMSTVPAAGPHGMAATRWNFVARVRPAHPVVGGGADAWHRGILQPGSIMPLGHAGTPTWQCGPYLRYDPSRADLAVVATHRFPQRGSILVTQAGDPVHAGPVSVGGADVGDEARNPLLLFGSPARCRPVDCGSRSDTTVMRNQLAAVLLVGITGYGCQCDLRLPRSAR